MFDYGKQNRVWNFKYHNEYLNLKDMTIDVLYLFQQHSQFGLWERTEAHWYFF